ncbi:hypothetical protein [Streptomyces sp. NBC_00322]|uniref:hypothetical protein n=1 Tax=Streptomyces sp. NBC_00322 TaxID=2975712 RepID=UPI002E2860EB|nr:hypothetical protein [Streptomyces sp. NBC_00322]
MTHGLAAGHPGNRHEPDACAAWRGRGAVAKTGTAEVDSQTESNSWFTGYRGDVAAAVTQEGGHGGDAAGPIVAAVRRAGAEGGG